MILTKYYQDVLTYENKTNEETSMYEHSNESIEVKAYLILVMRWKII